MISITNLPYHQSFPIPASGQATNWRGADFAAENSSGELL